MFTQSARCTLHKGIITLTALASVVGLSGTVFARNSNNHQQARPAAAAACTKNNFVVTCTYAFTGAAETWIVPAGVTQVTFQVVGAPGGRSGGQNFSHSDGGRGADLRATLTLTPGTPVIITVGGPGGSDGRSAGGFNGGGGIDITGNSYPIAGGGGGASDVRIGGAGLADRVLVAGGGGGGGGYGAGSGPGGSQGPTGGVGGDAGAAGAAGSTSAATGSATSGGGGGAATGSAGGSGGTAGTLFGVAGNSGALGQGGNIVSSLSTGMGGGGGGGLYGGGSGGSGGEDFSVDETTGGGGGGGGASGYTTGFGITNVALSVDSTRVPKVVITYTDLSPSITTQPADQTVLAGAQASFTAAADGSPAPTVQWQVSTDSGATWSNIPGATGNTLSFTAQASDNGKQFHAVFTNASGSATTNAATLTVNTPPSITTQPADQTVNAGAQASFTAAASGSPAPTVQWQFITPGALAWSNIPGATATTYSFTAQASDNGKQFRAIFTNIAGSVTSNAATLTVIYDTTPPVITPNVVGTLGNNGWYVSNVNLTWSVSDPDSAISNQTGCDASSVTSDTSGVSFTCTATSAGGSDSKSVTIQRDATQPIVVSGTPDRAPNASGWYNAPMTVTFAGSDATSGIASCTSPTYSGPDSSNTSVSGTCTDNAGNTSNAVGFGLKYDATPPTLNPSVLPNPASLNLPATATPNASDATSGVASQSCGTPNTSSTGSKSVSCTATDNADNTATANASYSVINDPPTIAVAPGGACLSDSAAKGLINLTVNDINTGPTGLTMRLVSNSNPSLVPNSGVVFAGSGANRTLQVTAADKKSGAAALTIGVSDGVNTTSLVITVFVGTSGNETLNGTAGTDMMFGLAGANTLNGLAGNDLLCGGNGMDTLNGGDGDDTLNGGRGADMLNGGAGNDRLTGGLGGDRFNGGPGTDNATDFTPSQGDTQDGTLETFKP